ncbi:MAG TPA: ABC transporter permease [Gemmatimonadales bacterium]|nr:ABC transporter permease [Gemmatimonadales bacterium]
MIPWLARRMAQAVLTFVVVTVLLFVLMRLTPGDPLERLTGDRAVSAEETAELRARFGIDQPIAAQFRAFVLGALTGNLGVSIEHYPTPVSTLLASRLPASLLLGGTVILLTFGLGVSLGVLQAVRRGQRSDRWLTRASLALYAMPSFWLGLVLAWYFGIRHHLLPVAQMHDPLLSPDAPWLMRAGDTLQHLVLPAVTLTAVSVAAVMRYQRTALLEVLRLDFVLAARARGLPERLVLWRHAWRNALFPVIGLLGLWLPILVSGSVFVEQVFNWPGLGSLAANAVGARDYPVILGTAMLVSALVLLGGILADIGYFVLDPRVRRA